jgi:hypothetical protein
MTGGAAGDGREPAGGRAKGARGPGPAGRGMPDRAVGGREPSAGPARPARVRAAWMAVGAAGAGREIPTAEEGNSPRPGLFLSFGTRRPSRPRWRPGDTPNRRRRTADSSQKTGDLWLFRRVRYDEEYRHPGRNTLMSDALACLQRNREAARRINEEARRDPRSSLMGKFVGIVDGQVVAVADELDEVVESLRRIEADPSRTFCFEAGLDYGRAEDIWGLR